MSIINSRMSLYEIEECLEKEVLRPVRIIGDINLNNEEINHLSLKIKGLNSFSYDISAVETYKLALLTSFVFRIKKEADLMGNIESIRTIYQRLPQHHIRYYIDLFEDTFNEYGITTFDLDTKHFDGLFSILIAHAGIPEHLHPCLYDILDQSLHIRELTSFEPRLRKDFISKLNCWSGQYIDEKCLWNIINNCRDLLIDYKLNDLSQNDLFNKYNSLSSKLILNCINWCDECECLRQEHS